MILQFIVKPRSVDGAGFRNLGILVIPSWKQRVRDA